MNAIVPLFVPGDRADRFAKAESSGTDAIILDLEDAVSADRKQIAREAIANHGITRIPVIVRINSPSSEECQDDLRAIRDLPLDGVMVAKAENTADLSAIVESLPKCAAVIPLIETVNGLRNAYELLCVPGVSHAGFGAYDFASDLGCRPAWTPLLFARSELVFVSRAANCAAPWDSPSSSIDDLIEVEDEAVRAAELGFAGKMAIHPKQITQISRAFVPAAVDLAWAQRIIAAADTGQAVRVEGQMVDKPILDRARKIIERGARAAPVSVTDKDGS